MKAMGGLACCNPTLIEAVSEPTKIQRRAIGIQALKFSCSAEAAVAAAVASAPGLHKPVLAEAVASLLVGRQSKVGASRDRQRIVLLDATFGAGGHTRQLLKAASSEASAPMLTVFANDRDPAAHGLARQLASSLSSSTDYSVVPLLGKFSQLGEHAELTEQVVGGGLDGALFDLGLCSTQLDSPQRGFALSADGPLDMRMSGLGEAGADSPTAADFVNGLEAGDLAALFRAYGEEPKARQFARAVVEWRRGARGPLRTTKQLAECLAEAGAGRRKDSLGRTAHPATRVFQALRIAVNDEFTELLRGLDIAWQMLKPGAPCVVLSFHSLEDRLVKRVFANRPLDDLCVPAAWSEAFKQHRPLQPLPMVEPMHQQHRRRWNLLKFESNRGEDYLTAGPDELEENPRARSARLRVALKLEDV